MEFDSDSKLINTGILNLEKKEREVLNYINNQDEHVQFYLKSYFDGYVFVNHLSEIKHKHIIKWFDEEIGDFHFSGIVLKIKENGTLVCLAFGQVRFLNFYKHSCILRKKTKAEIILGMYTKLGLNNLNDIKVNMLSDSEDEEEGEEIEKE